MIPIALAIAGLVALAMAALLLRRTGSAYRVARVLAAAPDVPLSELVAAIAPGSPTRYVRTHGRISSDEEFPDEANRPLVFRRRRLERGTAAATGRSSTSSGSRFRSGSRSAARSWRSTSTRSATA